MQYGRHSRKQNSVKNDTIVGREYLSPESTSKVATTSSMTNADEKPSTIRVKKRRTAQKLEPGMDRTAWGSVKKPTVKAPRSPASFHGHRPRFPTMPKMAKAAKFSKMTLEEQMRMASITALLCF